MDQIMLIAVIQGRNSDETIKALNDAGYYVTLLSTTGGFLKQKNATLLIGVEEDKKQAVIDIIKEYAGHRKEIDYQLVSSMSDHGTVPAAAFTPSSQVMKEVGGGVVFELALNNSTKI